LIFRSFSSSTVEIRLLPGFIANSISPQAGGTAIRFCPNETSALVKEFRGTENIKSPGTQSEILNKQALQSTHFKTTPSPSLILSSRGEVFEAQIREPGKRAS
jgi:hypothetical protein